MLFNEQSPLETKIVTRRFGVAGVDTLDGYLANGGFEGFKKALTMTPEQIVQELKDSGLRGRGGAGFPTGMKISFVPRANPKPKYIVVNADEGEPGTCKDRLLMEFDPIQMIEGMMIAGRAIDSKAGYVYIRGEYRYLIDKLDR